VKVTSVMPTACDIRKKFANVKGTSFQGDASHLTLGRLTNGRMNSGQNSGARGPDSSSPLVVMSRVWGRPLSL
jgi:hypothetical protein